MGASTRCLPCDNLQRGFPTCCDDKVSCCAQCRKDAICGLAISADLQELLMAQPDFCDILSECQVQSHRRGSHTALAVPTRHAMSVNSIVPVLPQATATRHPHAGLTCTLCCDVRHAGSSIEYPHNAHHPPDVYPTIC
jgi:hypothetical protein